MCSSLCKCCDCKNFDNTDGLAAAEPGRSLMSLADVAAARSQQMNNLDNKLALIGGTKSRLPNMEGEKFVAPFLRFILRVRLHALRMAYSFVTDKVIEATSRCLLSQLAESERVSHDSETTQQLLLMEFGKCLSNIIQTANEDRRMFLPIVSLFFFNIFFFLFLQLLLQTLYDGS